LSKAELEAMAQEATVDCYGESEQVSGFCTMIADNLEVPFGTKVLGVDVLVEGLPGRLRRGTTGLRRGRRA
jgi:hypothetical protein